MIIGINGVVGSGKDTVGMIMQALTMDQKGRWYNNPLEYVEAYKDRPNLKGGWQIKKYAYKLKQIASILTGIPQEKFEDQEFKKTLLGKEWESYSIVRDAGHRKVFTQSTPHDMGLFKDCEEVHNKMTVREFLQKLGTDAIRVGLHDQAWVNALFADYKEGDSWIVTDVRFPNEAQAIKDRGGYVVRVERSGNPFPKSDHISETALNDWNFDLKIVNTTYEGLVGNVKEAMNKLGVEQT